MGKFKPIGWIRQLLREALHRFIIILPLSPWKKRVTRDFMFMACNLPVIEYNFHTKEKPPKVIKSINKEKESIPSYVKVFYPYPEIDHTQKEYVYFNKTESLDAAELTIKCIAFYLPQFHAIPENDAWWGKNFTEWTNVTRAIPQFVGHYQPRLPGDLGFYNLRHPDIMYQQAALAAHYGISGFCIYYYSFNGKRLLETPHQHILNNPDLQMPFCLCWANENWTRRWDGRHDEILIEQHYSEENDLEIITDLVGSFQDPRYIRVKGRPLIMIYRPMDITDPTKTINTWRSYCRAHDVGEIYVIAVESIERINPGQYGFDATVEFPPHQLLQDPINNSVEILNPKFEGIICDYKDMVSSFTLRKESGFTRFSTVAPSWDNEARKPGNAHSWTNSSPYLYSRWLQNACQRTKKYPEGERFVFINAWNEWAEGAYLEPDKRFGYAYLQATSDVLKQYNHRVLLRSPILTQLESTRTQFVKNSQTAIIIHLYYEDLIDDFWRLLSQLEEKVDLFITVNHHINEKDIIKIISLFPNAYILDVQNRGRDILPFYLMFPIVKNMGYHQVCKLHTKKSWHLVDGDQWRTNLWTNLLSKKMYRRVIDLFKTEADVGMIALNEYKINLSNHDYHADNRDWLEKLTSILDSKKKEGNFDWDFAAGSMFWFRPTALQTLEKLQLNEDDFEPEQNQLDGTLAHSLERLFTLMAETEGFKTVWLDGGDSM